MRLTRPAVAVAAMMAVYAGLLGYLSLRRQQAFWTGRFDVGNMVQAVWSTAHGRPLETTDTLGRQFTRLGAHVDPILVLFTPLTWTGHLPQALLVSQAVIVATVTVMRGVQGRRFVWPRVLTDWLFLEPLAHRLVVRPVEVLAHRLAHLDDAVLDRGVEATAGGTVRLARAAALLDDRVIDGAVVRVVSGVRRLGGLARRPQTGQLHQYYLQALAVLALVLVVLVLVR